MTTVEKKARVLDGMEIAPTKFWINDRVRLDEGFLGTVEGLYKEDDEFVLIVKMDDCSVIQQWESEFTLVA